MAERKHYEVDVNGIKHTFLLDPEDVKRRYPNAKEVEDPAAGSAAEKLLQEFNDKANARPAEGEGEQVQTSPSIDPDTDPDVDLTDGGAEEKGKTPANKSRAAANKTA